MEANMLNWSAIRVVTSGCEPTVRRYSVCGTATFVTIPSARQKQSSQEPPSASAGTTPPPPPPRGGGVGEEMSKSAGVSFASPPRHHQPAPRPRHLLSEPTGGVFSSVWGG